MDTTQTVWTLLKEQGKDGDPASGRMPAYKIGKNWMIVRDELKEWLRMNGSYFRRAYFTV